MMDLWSRIGMGFLAFARLPASAQYGGQARNWGTEFPAPASISYRNELQGKWLQLSTFRPLTSLLMSS